MRKFKRLCAIGLLATLGIAGCATIEGAGEDIESAGEEIQEAADA